MRTSVIPACLLASALVAACSDGGSPTTPTCNSCPCAPDAGATHIETPTGCSPGAPQTSAFDAPGASATATHFGPVQVGNTVQFDVPAGTASLTIVEQAVSTPAPPIAVTLSQFSCAAPLLIDNVAVPLRVTDPDGNVVYDDTFAPPASGEAHRAFFASDSPFTGTFTIPNTSAALQEVTSTGQLKTGPWSLTVSDFGYECTLPQTNGVTCTGGSRSSVYDVTIITKPVVAGGIPVSGTIDVAFYLVTDRTGTGRPFDLQHLDGDPDLQRVRRTLASIFGRLPANISLGSVTFHPLADAIAKYGDIGLDVDEQGGCAEVPQLLANAKPGNALNIFLVSSLHSGETKNGNEVVGIDGTIPGPASIGGTVASGAAVSVGDLGFRPSGVSPGSPGDPCSSASLDLNCGDDRVAYIIAHEAGHFLGLYHTTESDGTSFDPLRDTAQCPCRTCAPRSQLSQCADATTRPGSPYQMTVGDCSLPSAGCGGGDNLMFWLFGRGSQGNLTAEQTQVMRANPLVH